jgi:hypothetical protein
MAKVTKTAKVVEIMTKNASRPMAEVSRIIETQLPCKEGYGKVWYRWAVKEGVAPGTLEKAERTPKAKAAKVAKPKVETKSPDEVAEIKAKNLATIKSVAKKYNQVARPERDTEVVSKAEMKRRKAEIDAFTNYETDELPSFRSPEKLTKDEVKYLV